MTDDNDVVRQGTDESQLFGFQIAGFRGQGGLHVLHAAFGYFQAEAILQMPRRRCCIR